MLGVRACCAALTPTPTSTPTPARPSPSPPLPDRLLLTVLKCNASALAFYTGKLKYSVSALSPSQHGEDAAHEILAKCVDAKGWAAAQEGAR